MSSIADMLAELRGQPAPQPVEEPVPDDSAARIEALEKSVSELQTALVEAKELLRALVRSPPPGSPRPSPAPRTPPVLSFPSPQGVVGGSDLPRSPAPRLRNEDALPLPGPPASPAPFLSTLSVKDALSQLDSISGNKDRSSRVIDPDELLHCADWLDASAWKLTTAGIPECHHAGLLVQKLTGPLLVAFRSRAVAETWDMRMTATQFRERLLSLFAVREVAFTNKLIDMPFRLDHLVSDIQNFRVLAMHSAFAKCLDDNQYLLDLVRKKLNAAVPNALVIAATRYQLTLDQSLPFQAFLDLSLIHISEPTRPY